MAVPIEQFVKQLEDSGVLAGETIKDFLPPRSDPKDVEELLRELVRQEKLTRFQADEIRRGKGRSLVLGNYLLLEKIGAGGMGRVFKARHRVMDRIVAVKLLPAPLTRDQTAIARFQREVKAAARISHPNIVTAFDADQAKGVHFLVVEYVEGSDLSTLVKKSGPLPVETAVDYLLQAARGLEAAHKNGIVHRDIKPANLLLDKEGIVKVLDMGLARLTADADSSKQAELTNTGALMGTVDYMAPEQALNSKAADARADIYSLGCSLFYLLTGRPVYPGDTLIKKILAHREQPIPSLRAIRPEVPEQVESLFSKMVAKNFKNRFQSMTHVITDLEACRADREPSASTQPSGRTSGDTTSGSVMASFMKRRFFGNPEDFDPYHKWLGIPPDKRPPTFYQLLGISPSEDDREAITAAADRQQNFVRQFRGGPHDEAAASILFQIEDARTTLLDHEARRKYDATLHVAHKRQRENARGRVLRFGSGSNAVGEGSGLASQFAGIMAVIIAGFVIMALVSFYISRDRDDTNPVVPAPQFVGPPVPEVQPRPDEVKKIPRAEPIPKNAVDPAPVAAKICRAEVLKELPAGANHASPWLSTDGMTLYFVSLQPNDKQAWIWSGRRKDKNGMFGDFQRLLPGTEPTVTGDGLEMILNVDNSLESTTRTATDEAFRRPGKIDELKDAGLLAGPSLTSNGLTLYADRWAPGTKDPGTAPVELVRYTRTSRRSQWGPPETVKFANLPEGVDGYFRYLSVTADQLHALAMLRTWSAPDRRVVVFSRKTSAVPFGAPTMVSVNGDTRFGQCPRYVESTGELFCSRVTAGRPTEIVAIRDFAFETATAPLVVPGRPRAGDGSVRSAPGAVASGEPREWISIMPTKEEVSRTNYAKYQNDVLNMNVEYNGTFGSRKRGYEAKDGIIRVVVKKLAGESVILLGRASAREGFYSAHYNGDGFGLGKYVNKNGKSTYFPLAFKKAPKKFNDFFEFTLRVEGDLLTVLADGKEVVRARDSEISGKGEMAFSPQKGRGLYKKAEIRILD
jgi:serine/threonine-protein kinase